MSGSKPKYVGKHNWSDGVCQKCYINKTWPGADKKCAVTGVITRKDSDPFGYVLEELQAQLTIPSNRFQIHGSEIHEIVVATRTIPADIFITEMYIRYLLRPSIGVLTEYQHGPTEPQLAVIRALQYGSIAGYLNRITKGNHDGYRTHFWYIIN